jgi:hypothetical protein
MPINLVFGTPNYASDKNEEQRDELNPQHLQVWSNFPCMKQENVMSSIRKFNEEVMPKFEDKKT